MKRAKRNPEMFEVINLYTALARNNDYKPSADEDLDKFIGRAKDSLKSFKKYTRQARRMGTKISSVNSAGNFYLVSEQSPAVGQPKGAAVSHSEP